MPYHKLKIQRSKIKTFEGFTLRSASQLRSDIKVRPYGFTLIEFVVVLGVLGFLLGSIMLFLNSTLRGANQTNITQEVKQNGQAVLDSLDKQIRGATNVAGIGAGPNYTTIVLTRPNDDPLYIKCLSSTATQNDRIGSVSMASGSPSDSNFISVSNDDRVKGVEITNCSFGVTSKSASQGSNIPAVVSVQFTASQGLDAPTRADFMASANFNTTISLRTY